MNYKVAKTMLCLCVAYLIAFYVLKFFFPEMLLQTITHPTLLRLGEFMNQYPFTTVIFQFISSSLTFYLFACAGSGRFKFTTVEFVFLGIIVIANNVVYYILPELYTHTCTSLMLLSAVVAKGNLKYTTISFVLHGYLSQFLLSIRGFETITLYFNAISGFLINLEGFVWLALLSIIFYLKENNKNGTLASSVCK